MDHIARPRDAAELAVILPYQLGYHPGPSLCLTVMRGRRLGLLQRHDLVPEPAACRAVAEHAIAIAVREGATAVLLMAFEEDEGESRHLRAAMTAAAREAGLRVQEHFVVRDGRCYPAGGPRARRRLGIPLPRPEDVPAVATFVEAGVCPLPSRAHLVDAVLPERDEARARRIALAVNPLEEEYAHQQVARTWARLLDPSADATPVADLSDAELLVLSASLQDVDWRDALLGGLCPGAVPFATFGDPLVEHARTALARCPWALVDPDAGSVPDAAVDVGRHQEDVLAVRARVAELGRLVPEELTPPLLTCTAHIAWWMGDGTIAGSCLERALQIEPGYRLAGLMLDLLSAGLRPWDLGPDARAGRHPAA